MQNWNSDFLTWSYINFCSSRYNKILSSQNFQISILPSSAQTSTSSSVWSWLCIIFVLSTHDIGFVDLFYDFWIQKSHNFYDFWIQNFFCPFWQFLDPETAVFLRFLNPKITPFLCFLEPNIFWSIFPISGSRKCSKMSLISKNTIQ